MIGSITYEDVEGLRKTLQDCIKKMSTYDVVNNTQRLKDFIRSVESYDKYLETTIEINKEVDIALDELKKLNNK